MKLSIYVAVSYEKTVFFIGISEEKQANSLNKRKYIQWKVIKQQRFESQGITNDWYPHVTR